MEKIKSLLSGHSTEDKHSTDANQYESGLSEATTDQEGRKLSTGAGILGHQSSNTTQPTSHAGQGSHLADATGKNVSEQQGYPGMTQDTRRTPIVQSGAQHGSGRELGGSSAANVTPGFSNNAHESNAPHSSNPTSSTTAHTSTTTSEQHLGRDAAVIGTSGAVGEGIHHHRENNVGNSSGTTALAGTSNSGLDFGSGRYGSAQGPHSTHTANLLDPALNPGTEREDAFQHSEKHGGGAEHADSSHSPIVTSSKGNIGRDAALASGSAGAIGVGESERNKQHTHQPTGIGGTHSTPSTVGQSGSAATTTTTSTALPSTLGSSTAQPDSHNHHRDAALVGGVGAAGAGAYAVDKHLKSDAHGTTVGDSGSSLATGQNIAGSGVNSNVQRQTHAKTDSDTTREHNLSGDSTSTGKPTVASTAFYETQQHRHDKDLTKAEHEAKKQQKHAEKEAKKEHHDEKEAKKERKGSILSFLHRDKNKKYSPEEEAEFDRQEREHNSSQAARNTAAGTGAIGAGVAAHEVNKHHEDSHSTSKPVKKDIGDLLHGEARNRGVAGSSGFPGEPGFGDGSTSTVEDWKERDHEAQEQHRRGSVPLDKKPVGKDIGDYLHGAARNRGVVGSSGFENEPGFGDGTVAGSGVDTGSSYATSEPKAEQTGRNLPTSTSSTGTGSDHIPRSHTHDSILGSNTATTTSSNQHDNSTANSGLGSKTGGTSQMGSGTTSGDSHVPASSTARGNIVSEGRSGMDSNTGVANAGSTTGNTY